MNLYLCIRILLHSLLFITNLLALTAAAWGINSARKIGEKVSPGAVLVLLGGIAYCIIETFLWIGALTSHQRWSRMRFELKVFACLCLWQIIASIVSTANLAQSVCKDQTSCVSVLILSWLGVFMLIVYSLIIYAIGAWHQKHDPDVWEASLLEYSWFSGNQDTIHQVVPFTNVTFEDNVPPPPPKAGVEPLNVRKFSIPKTITTPNRASFIPGSSGMAEPTTPPKAYAPRRSIWDSITPQWARRWQESQKRARDLPFPATVPTRRMEQIQVDTPVSPVPYPSYATGSMVRRMDPPRTPIDAPVSPMSYRSEFEDTTTSDPFKFDREHGHGNS